MRERMMGALVLLAMASCAPAAEGPVPGGQAEVRSTLEFLTLNIGNDQDDWPARLEALAAGVKAAAPDVICLQEVLEEPGLPNQAETLATRLGYRVHFASSDSAGSPKRFGDAILTRAPILDADARRLEPADDHRVVAHVRVKPAQDTLDVYCTHLHDSPEGSAIRRTQVLDALEFIDLTRGEGPVIFAGDFNAPASAPELAPVLDRFGDAYATVHGDTAAEVTTLNTAKGHAAARIDHVFFRSGLDVDLAPTRAELALDEPTGAGVWPSDHFGVLIRFEIRTVPRAPTRRSLSGEGGRPGSRGAW